MKLSLWLAALLLLLPSLASAAGFAKQSLFLSKTPVTEGESVLVHAVVQNDAGVQFTGELVFSTQIGTGAKEKIGAVAIAMAPGGAQAASVSWKPLAGDYTVTAALTLKDGTVADEQTAHFSINKKPEPVTATPAATYTDTEVASSADVQALIAKFSPTVADMTKPAFLTIDTLRIKAGKFIDQGATWSKTQTGGKTPGQVLGSATTKEATSPRGLVATGTFLFASISLYVLSILKWIIANPGIFYPVFAIGFLFLLWKLLSGFRRPRY